MFVQCGEKLNLQIHQNMRVTLPQDIVIFSMLAFIFVGWLIMSLDTDDPLDTTQSLCKIVFIHSAQFL